MTTTAVNSYLDGNFAPVREEITTDTIQVIGELPPNLSGIFVRNGPNPQWSPIGKYHWFDGDGMLHGVSISNSKATYRNRYVARVLIPQRVPYGFHATWISIEKLNKSLSSPTS